MKDYTYLNALADDFATLELDETDRDRLYQEIFQGVFEYLIRIVPLAVEGMSKLDIVLDMSKKKIPKWISLFNPARKKFLNYISNNAQLAQMNIFRDNCESKPSRAAYDFYQKIQASIQGGMDRSEALNMHLYHSGAGLLLQKQVESLLVTNLDPISLSIPLHGRDDEGRQVSLEDKLVYNEPAFEMDRNVSIEIGTLPPRFKILLEQLRHGANVKIHDLDFGRPGMRLTDKLVMLDTAFRMAAKLSA